MKRLSRPFKPGRYAAGLRVPIPEYAGAVGKVRYVGEPVAIVAADTRARAEDALELIEVDYEPLPAVVSTEAAVLCGARSSTRSWGATSPGRGRCRTATSMPPFSGPTASSART